MNYVVHVRWDLPFPLMLEPEAFLCWEPVKGIAAFVPEGQVGTITWKRTCDYFSAQLIFGEEPPKQDPSIYPKSSYRFSCEIGAKENIVYAELLPGENGGFQEARPYSCVNVFLLEDSIVELDIQKITNRASFVINNVINTYKLLTADPIMRPINNELDHYYTMISKAELPESFHKLKPSEILLKIHELAFINAVGPGMGHKIGISSLADVSGISLNYDNKALFYKQVQSEITIDLFFQLIFSSIRHIKRGENAFALIDAQSAFESAVADMLKDGLRIIRGWNVDKIGQEFAYKGSLHLLGKKLKMIDKLSHAYQHDKFAGGIVEKEWRDNLYEIRNSIVHGGIRAVPFDVAKKALISGLKAIRYISELCPVYNRRFMWTIESMELSFLRNNAPRLSRMFDI